MTGNFEKISIVIIASNAAKTIEKTLYSVKNFKEVIVYENNSVDNTVKIVKKFKNVRLIQGDFLGFGITKNKATKFASNDWVFLLDSDEVLTQEFLNSLNNITLDDNTVYQINRVNFYKDFKIKYCWGNDIITRIYNRKKTSFSNKKVHEFVQDNGFKKILITGDIKHYPYNSISDFIIKLDRYSTQFALENRFKKNSSIIKAFFSGLYSFIKTYFFKQGFRDGYIGLVIAFSHMATNFYKYIKLYEINKKSEKLKAQCIEV